MLLHGEPTWSYLGALLQLSTQAPELTDDEVNAYRAPFPGEEYMAGAREFPTLVPISPEHGGAAENRAAWAELERWTKPFLTLWCPDDPVLGHLRHETVERIPGAEGEPHQEFTPGGHFIQDDRDEDVATALVDWLRWPGSRSVERCEQLRERLGLSARCRRRHHDRGDSGVAPGVDALPNASHRSRESAVV